MNPTNQWFRQFYPNPNDGSMWVRYSIKSTGKASLSSSSGVIKAEYNLDPEKNYLLIKEKSLYQGVYILKIITESKVVFSGKVTVLR